MSYFVYELQKNNGTQSVLAPVTKETKDSALAAFHSILSYAYNNPEGRELTVSTIQNETAEIIRSEAYEVGNTYFRPDLSFFVYEAQIMENGQSSTLAYKFDDVSENGTRIVDGLAQALAKFHDVMAYAYNNPAGRIYTLATVQTSDGDFVRMEVHRTNGDDRFLIIDVTENRMISGD